MASIAIENRTFDEIRIGESASLAMEIRPKDIELYSAISGDANPVPLDAGSSFTGGTALGLLPAGLISNLLGNRLPGAGTICLGHALRFERAALAGDTITATVTAREKRPGNHVVVFDCVCANQRGETVVTGSAEVIAPTKKVKAIAAEPAEVRIRRHAKYERLIGRAKELPPIPTIVAHPCDETSLRGAIEAAEAGIIVPVLVGPEDKIRSVAEKFAIDIASFDLVPAEHSHAAAAKAVELVRAGKGELLMKGSLHSDELLHEVAGREGGLRTARRISHVFIMDVPTYPDALFITDAAVNIAPDLDAKHDIVQNAIDLHLGLGLGAPRVAILSAVETVTSKIPGTIDAAALCKMADRRQITGGLLDGPLALDNAISREAAAIKGITSEVAGRAQILVVPDLEAGNMLAKNLTFLAEADAAGIVLGARVPIILTSRADSVRARMASCAIAALYAHSRRPGVVALAAE
jgi:phosphate acetyltransferase